MMRQSGPSRAEITEREAEHDAMRRPGWPELAQPTLFGPTPTPHYDVRWDSPSTSREAAASIAPVRTALHQAVLDALRAGGPMTDEQLERLPQFHQCGPSTIRKRRSELFHQGALKLVGEARNSRGRRMLVWGVA